VNSCSQVAVRAVEYKMKHAKACYNRFPFTTVAARIRHSQDRRRQICGPMRDFKAPTALSSDRYGIGMDTGSIKYKRRLYNSDFKIIWTTDVTELEDPPEDLNSFVKQEIWCYEGYKLNHAKVDSDGTKCECGVWWDYEDEEAEGSRKKRFANQTLRMVGDDEAFKQDVTTYPWFIPIAWTKSGSADVNYLVGNLISNDVIMTVEVADFPLSDSDGTLKIRIDKDTIKTSADVEKILTKDRVRLIFLKEKLDFSQTSARPVCLPNWLEVYMMRRYSIRKKMYLMETMGYEDIESIDFEGADPVKMRALKMRIRNRRWCQKKFLSPRFNSRLESCASGLVSPIRNGEAYEQRPGICKGDWGAGVMLRNRGSFIKRRREKQFAYTIMGVFNQYAPTEDPDNCGTDPSKFTVITEAVRKWMLTELKDTEMCRRPVEDFQVGEKTL